MAVAVVVVAAEGVSVEVVETDGGMTKPSGGGVPLIDNSHKHHMTEHTNFN